MRLNFALSITFLLARASAEIIGPHLLDGTDAPTLHRDIAQSVVSIDDLLTPFAGKKPGLAFRVHADNDAKTTDGGVADAIVASLRESGLPADPAEAAAVLEESPVPLSIERDYSGWIAYNDKEEEGKFVWEDGCTSSYTNWDAGPPQEPNNDPNYRGEDCTIKWNDGTVWNDVPCDFTYPCYCQAVKGGD